MAAGAERDLILQGLRQVTLENFRCFREPQMARLAPLTLLVGENSTGKTSFLALIRALAGIGRSPLPDFKEEPYDLGSFDEIAYFRGGRGGRAQSFSAGFEALDGTSSYWLEATFKRRGTAPAPTTIRIGDTEGHWIKCEFKADKIGVTFHTPRHEWQDDVLWIEAGEIAPLFVFLSVVDLVHPRLSEDEGEDAALKSIRAWTRQLHFTYFSPFASAPVRSKPHRTYDPARATRDSEGDYIPMFLANEHFAAKQRWTALKSALEHFGQEAGLFDEIVVKPLGKESGPFQLHVRRLGKRTKGPHRNLIDVGYGVSQVLPVVTELLRPDAPPLFLLQQPEVHLHPSAQAALGTLFCQVAGQGRQILVETHSDHLLDRVRMDVRDRTTKLKAKDVSILFFERQDIDVRIHSLRIDEDGNIVDAPAGYRRFFMEEIARSIWK